MTAVAVPSGYWAGAEAREPTGRSETGISTWPSPLGSGMDLASGVSTADSPLPQAVSRAAEPMAAEAHMNVRRAGLAKSVMGYIIPDQSVPPWGSKRRCLPLVRFAGLCFKNQGRRRRRAHHKDFLVGSCSCGAVR